MDAWQNLRDAFRGEDPRFLTLLRRESGLEELAAFTDEWVNDPRPWAQSQIVQYLQQPLSGVGHQAVVKRLLRHAERTRNHDLMAWLLVAFDRLVRFHRRRVWSWDARQRQATSHVVLELPRNATPLRQSAQRVRNPRTGQTVERPVGTSREHRLFRYRTRYYLRRRAWRYFRLLAFRSPGEYAPAVARALSRYSDDDLHCGEDVLESWGLAHACFGEHASLHDNATRFTVRPGHTLTELSPAPCFPELWESDDALTALLRLAASARSQLVRQWSLQMLDLAHAEHLPALAFAQFEPLLENHHPEVSAFAVRWLPRLQTLSRTPIADWLRCLAHCHPGAAAPVAQILCESLRSQTLSADDCLLLACVQHADVSQFACKQLQNRVLTEDERSRLANVANCRCARTAAWLTTWALQQADALAEDERRTVLVRCFEADLPETRRAAWHWLQQTEGSARRDAELWAKVLATTDGRLQRDVADFLHREGLPEFLTPAQLEPLWRHVLYQVHGGHRQQLKAVAQVREAVLAYPNDADLLLPLLVHAARSVRQPLARAGLSAVATLAVRHPELQPRISQRLPEVQFR